MSRPGQPPIIEVTTPYDSRLDTPDDAARWLDDVGILDRRLAEQRRAYELGEEYGLSQRSGLAALLVGVAAGLVVGLIVGLALA